VKLIDWEIKPKDVIRLYFCKDEDYDKAWGDDWNDAPWCYNAGPVYDKYVAEIWDVRLLHGHYAIECDEYAGFGINPMFSKEDFKNGILPAFIISRENRWEYNYLEPHNYLELRDTHRGDHIYLGMSKDKVISIMKHYIVKI
jgi:hypothetical protein